MGNRGKLSWFQSLVSNEKWKNHSVSAFQAWLQCNFWIFFTIFQNIKQIYEIFSLLFPLLWIYLVLNHNESFSFSKPFMHQFAHFSPSLMLNYFFVDLFHPPDIHMIWQNSHNPDWDIIERFPVFFIIIKLLYFTHSSGRGQICSYQP